MNHYTYVENNPIENVDPTGLYVVSAGGFAGAAWGVDGANVGAGEFYSSESGFGTYCYTGKQWGLAAGSGLEVGCYSSEGAMSGFSNFISIGPITVS